MFDFIKSAPSHSVRQGRHWSLSKDELEVHSNSKRSTNIYKDPEGCKYKSPGSDKSKIRICCNLKYQSEFRKECFNCKVYPLFQGHHLLVNTFMLYVCCFKIVKVTGYWFLVFMSFLNISNVELLTFEQYCLIQSFFPRLYKIILVRRAGRLTCPT